jgi:hypothetical protein
MARASAATLEKLNTLLAAVRQVEGLTERNPGIFYFKREPMLHFHDNGGAVVAHMKAAGGGFDEFTVAIARERTALVKELQRRCMARQQK